MPAAKKPASPPRSNKSGYSRTSITDRARKEAAETGLLPHEWLLKVMRGEGIEQKYWDIKRDKNGNEINRELKSSVIYAPFGDRVDAAKAAAPYYAARLATQVIAVGSPEQMANGSLSGLDLGGLNESELKTVKKILTDAMMRGIATSKAKQ